MKFKTLFSINSFLLSRQEFSLTKKDKVIAIVEQYASGKAVKSVKFAYDAMQGLEGPLPKGYTQKLKIY